MKTIFLFFSTLIMINGYCQKTERDPIYYKLFLFLDTQNHIPKEMMDNSYDNYAELLYIEELFKGYSYPYENLEQDKFGVYKLEYIGLAGDASFIFIKYEEKYKIFRKNNYSLIIRELLKIKKKNNCFLSDELFSLYIQKLIEVNDYEDKKFSLEQIDDEIQYIYYPDTLSE